MLGNAQIAKVTSIIGVANFWMSNCIIHSEETIDKIRKAAKMTAFLRNELCKKVRPGISTLELDEMAKVIIKDLGAESAFHKYKGFPGQFCISINDEIVHGYGKPDRIIGINDLVTIDCGVKKDGCLGDSAVTISLAPATGRVAELLDVTKRSLDAAIDVAVEGNTVRDIGATVYAMVKDAGFEVIRDFCGHGVGTDVHQPPQIPNYPSQVNEKLKKGMVIAIEPMVSMGGWGAVVDPDRWTARTKDGSLSAHFEHTILITEGKAEVLTI
jgi:methionyl aminopeptidase